MSLREELAIRLHGIFWHGMPAWADCEPHEAERWRDLADECLRQMEHNFGRGAAEGVRYGLQRAGAALEVVQAVVGGEIWLRAPAGEVLEVAPADSSSAPTPPRQGIGTTHGEAP